MVGTIEYNAELADERFDELPEPGDRINWNGEERLVKSVHVVNESKLVLNVWPVSDMKRYDKPGDYSVDWEKLPDRFL